MSEVLIWLNPGGWPNQGRDARSAALLRPDADMGSNLRNKRLDGGPPNKKGRALGAA